MAVEYTKNNFTISTDHDQLDLAVIHAYLTRSYWSPGIPREFVAKAIENSLCFGLYHDDKQIGFARVVTDYTSHGYLCDVFVLENYQGRGLGKWMVEVVVNFPALQNIRRILLITDDAQELYNKFGFQPLNTPQKFMEKFYERPWYKGTKNDD